MANPILNQIARLVERGLPESTARKIVSGELPMDTYSRIRRAKDQGYDVNRLWYHGTNKDIFEFDPSTIGTGAGKTPAMLPQGFYFTRVPEAASEYATGEGANILPVYLRAQDTITRGDLRAFKDFNEGIGDSLLSRSEDVMVVRNPNQIRSRNAAFDPDQVGNPNILASAAPVAAGGLLAALGMPDRATAAETAISPEYLNVDKEQAGSEIQQMILDALLNLMAPSQIGDSTMTGRARNASR